MNGGAFLCQTGEGGRTGRVLSSWLNSALHQRPSLLATLRSLPDRMQVLCCHLPDTLWPKTGSSGETRRAKATLYSECDINFLQLELSLMLKFSRT